MSVRNWRYTQENGCLMCTGKLLGLIGDYIDVIIKQAIYLQILEVSIVCCISIKCSIKIFYKLKTENTNM